MLQSCSVNFPMNCKATVQEGEGLCRSFVEGETPLPPCAPEDCGCQQVWVYGFLRFEVFPIAFIFYCVPHAIMQGTFLLPDMFIATLPQDHIVHGECVYSFVSLTYV